MLLLKLLLPKVIKASLAYNLTQYVTITSLRLRFVVNTKNAASARLAKCFLRNGVYLNYIICFWRCRTDQLPILA